MEVMEQMDMAMYPGDCAAHAAVGTRNEDLGRSVATQTEVYDEIFTNTGGGSCPEFVDDKENFLWFICPICRRAFSRHESKLMKHKEEAHGICKKNRTACIMSQVDLSPKLVLPQSQFIVPKHRPRLTTIRNSISSKKCELSPESSDTGDTDYICTLLTPNSNEDLCDKPIKTELVEIKIEPMEEDNPDQYNSAIPSTYDGPGDAEDSDYFVPSNLLEEGATSEEDFTVEESKQNSKPKRSKRRSKSKEENAGDLFNSTSQNVEEDNQSRFHCKLCSASFTNRRKHWYHSKIVHGPAPYTCEICQKPFQTESQYNDHQNVHTSSKPYMCSDCGKCFSTDRSLKSHQRRQHRKKIVTECNICGLKFSTAKSHAVHMRKHQSKIPALCSSCGKVFQSENALKKHFKEIHLGQKSLKHQCEICGYKTASPALLKMHKVSHTDDRPCTCPICGKTYKMDAALKNHLKTHAGKTKRFKCSKCDKAFTMRDTLTAHERREHAKGGPDYKFACKYCAKQFPIEKYLITHEARHLQGARKYECSTCGRRFMEQDRLKRHMQVHLKGGIIRKRKPDLEQVDVDTTATAPVYVAGVIGRGRGRPRQQPLPAMTMVADPVVVDPEALRS